MPHEIGPKSYARQETNNGLKSFCFEVGASAAIHQINKIKYWIYDINEVSYWNVAFEDHTGYTYIQKSTK